MTNYLASCMLNWNGHAIAENSGHVSIDDSSGTLNMGAIITGTPIIVFLVQR